MNAPTAPLSVNNPDDADLLNRIAIRLHDGQSLADIRLDLFLVYLAGYRAGTGVVFSAATDELPADAHKCGFEHREGLGYLAWNPDCPACCAKATQAAGYVDPGTVNP